MKTETLEEMRAPVPETQLRLLIVEHTAADVELALIALKESGLRADHTLVQTLDEFRNALAGGNYDAVLSDYRLPGWSGLDALHALRESGKDIPFLLVTGTLGEEAAVECMKKGVNDYILKGHISRLPLAVRRAVAEKALRDENAQAQSDLRLSEARNRALFENSVYAIFRTTFDGVLLDGNPALLGMLGRSSAEELNELNLMRDVIRFPEQCAALMSECRQRGQVRGAEMEWRRKDGGIVAVRLNVRRLNIPNHPDCLECIAEDVTEFRAMERQLRQAQKFEAIGQLAGGIAHDFNNVVGAILGWAELGIEQNRGRAQVTDRFTKIREQAERAATLTRELLAFARRQVLQPSAVNLNTVTSGLISFLDKVIPKDIELKVITGAVDAVKADPTQIEQVLMNLCLNARDAMPKGGRLLIETEMVDLDESYCRFYPQVAPGRYTVLSVSDTGQGMDAETRERIFEPFFTTKERGKGTGMGLATVYGIVKQHGGFIHVYSEPGQGSLFRVYLRAFAGTPSEGQLAKAPASSLGDPRGTETILIAEDHESIREMARQTLMNLGYRVLSAGDGVEALRLCENEVPAMAILDVIMPKMGGPATGAKLMALFDGIPILYTSGYSQDSESMAPAGADARYLQKPYSPTGLGRLVREILDQVKPQDENPVIQVAEEG
jgi:two-component system cell cycle sensor histidine kinase/response regulator CckA